MKKHVTTAFLLLFALAFSGCEKKLFDYRNKYLGNYQMTYHYSYWQMGGESGDTTVVYKGQINYGDKGKIKIDWYDDSPREFEISKKGEIWGCTPIGNAERKHFELTFTDDQCGTGPIGANYTVTLSGTKLKL